VSDWTPPSPRPQAPLPPRDPTPEPDTLYPQGMYLDPTFAESFGRPPKKSRTGLIVGLVLAGAAVLLAFAVAAALVIAHQNRTTREILTPQTAGGLTRDLQQESALADRLAQAEQGFRQGAFGTIESLRSAVYDKSRSGAGSPSGPIVFLGASVKAKGGPDDFVHGFSTSAASRGFNVTQVDAGADARGVCAQSRTSVVITICAWATDDSMGELLPTVQGWDTGNLAGLMREMRPDVEHKKS
jgi:hypothetical protein